MKRRTNQLNNTILLALALLTFYSCEKNDIVTLTVINELQECEEENMFYKIIEVNSGVTEFKDDRDSLVLLLFEDSLSTTDAQVVESFELTKLSKKKMLLIWSILK